MTHVKTSENLQFCCAAVLLFCHYSIPPFCRSTIQPFRCLPFRRYAVPPISHS
jgi:hypothetical protein